MQQQLTQGTTLRGGAYRIEQVLGQGSFGITYLATHTALNKQVTIKEFFMKELNGRGEDGSITGMSDGSLSMDYARKFQKEALNLARLEHPNIVRVTDSFADNGTFYYVMDYIEGENLNDYIKHNDISQQEAVDIIRDVATALMYMHEEKQMLHLDLKPGNIMRRTSDGHIFLIDFGLSKHYSSNGQPETSTTIGHGTPGYAPVEQANQAKNGEFRPTIDIYALGATFYKLLTGETPPAASELVSDEELLAENLKQHNINNNISQVVVYAMQPSAKKRLQSVRDFIGMVGAHTVNQKVQSSSKTAEPTEATIVEKGFVPTAKESKIRKSIETHGVILRNRLRKKESPIFEEEGIWHEFVRYAVLRESKIYTTRLGKVWFYPFILPTLIAIVFAVLGLKWEFFLQILEFIVHVIPDPIFGLWIIGFVGFMLIYFVACIWHFFKYDAKKNDDEEFSLVGCIYMIVIAVIIALIVKFIFLK